MNVQLLGVTTIAKALGISSFQVAKDDAYGQLPEPSGRGSYRLSDEYITTATEDVAQQLSKVGVRLSPPPPYRINGGPTARAPQ